MARGFYVVLGGGVAVLTLAAASMFELTVNSFMLAMGIGLGWTPIAGVIKQRASDSADEADLESVLKDTARGPKLTDQ